MADAIYPNFKEALLDGSANTDMSGGNVKVVLIDLTDYTYAATHTFLSDIPAGAREETSANLTGKTFTDGTFDADDPSFTGTTGDAVDAFVVYIDTGVEGTSRLVYYNDSAPEFPVTLGPDITIAFNASGVFTL